MSRCVRRLSAPLSQVGVVPKRLDKSSWLFLSHAEASLRPIVQYVIGKFACVQNKGELFETNPGHNKFRYGTSIIAKCCQLSTVVTTGELS